MKTLFHMVRVNRLMSSRCDQTQAIKAELACDKQSQKGHDAKAIARSKTRKKTKSDRIVDGPECRRTINRISLPHLGGGDHLLHT